MHTAGRGLDQRSLPALNFEVGFFVAGFVLAVDLVTLDAGAFFFAAIGPPFSRRMMIAYASLRMQGVSSSIQFERARYALCRMQQLHLLQLTLAHIRPVRA